MVGGMMKSTRVMAGFALAALLGAANAQTFTSSDGPVSVGPLATNGVYTPAPPYPSQITVPGSVTGTVTSVRVVLHGLAADGNNGLSTQGLGILLVAPDGRQLEIHRATGNGGDTLTNVTLNIADSNSLLMPDQNSAWPALTGAINVKPTAYSDATSPTNYVSPGPGFPAHTSAPAGSDTLTSVFTGSVAAGTWKLYVVDHYLSDAVSFTSWDLILTVAATQTSTTTVVTSNPNPSFTAGANSSVGLTANVSSTSGAPTGTVLFKDGANTIGGCSSVNLSPAGPNSSSATCTTTFLTEGAHSITAVYSGGGTFSASASLALNQFVKNHSTNPATGQYCNAGPISAPGLGNALPFPSVINVGTDTPALGGAVATLTVTLNGLSGQTGLGAVKALLVSPGGARSLVFLSDAGFSANQPSANVTFSDAAATQVGQNSALITGSYQA